MPQGRFSLGQVVQSSAGRDTGRIYLIVGFDPPARVWLADGRDRKAARPKRKNIRHIRVLKAVDQAIATKIASVDAVTDEDIRQAIRNCRGAGEY